MCAFYVDALGFIEVDRDADHLYLGGLEERDYYCLTLRRAESAGVGHLAFRVADEAGLDDIERLYQAHGLPTRWVDANTLEPAQGRALRVQDPSGLPFEFFHHIQQRDRLLQRFELYRGANVMRLDHFNCQVHDVQAAHDWWTGQMGFAVSEFTVADPPEGFVVTANQRDIGTGFPHPVTSDWPSKRPRATGDRPPCSWG